ncbi:MAG: host attachment protein [Pseudomonadota bacterium]
MQDTGVTWIVAADASEARFFSERARAGAVKELTEMRMSPTGAEQEAGRGQRATGHQRVGPGQHGVGERDPGHEAERRFLKRVANRLALESSQGAFDRLVLMGPPKALGMLKAELPPTVAAKVEATDPHERRRDDVEEIRRHLREARARA